MARGMHRITGWRWQGLVGTAIALLLSGLAWLALHYVWGAGAGELPHPLEAWAMRVHGLAGFAALFMLGVLAEAHIPHGWRVSGRVRHARQRATGVALCSLAGLLAISGYLLYYFAPEFMRPGIGIGHAAAGVAMAGLALLHARRKSRPA
jgi:hypothetical protein